MSNLKFLRTGYPKEVVLQYSEQIAGMPRGDSFFAEADALEQLKDANNNPVWNAVWTEDINLVPIGPRGTKPHGATPI